MTYRATDYVLRLRWHDGMTSYCKRCDAVVPLRLVDRGRSMLACALDHTQHALNVWMSRGGEV